MMNQFSEKLGLSFDPEMILIPAGEFLMGSDSDKDECALNDEQPQHSLYLSDYYLAKTPVTNAQYAAFIQATGYDPPVHWKGKGLPRDKEGHPVVCISWYDALAYCRWLSEATGKPYGLPSEAEWEKGARGSDGRIYPWGSRWDAGRCNSQESSRGDATSVEAYPQGASPYGLLDMAGNVWEWTRSLWGEEVLAPGFKYPYDPGDGREDLEADANIFRVLRGGAFINERENVRCAYRSRSSPYHLFRYLGFRVVVTSDSPLPSENSKF